MQPVDYSKMYIVVHQEVPPNMVPVLVAHSVVNAHVKFQHNPIYENWLKNSFRKCVVQASPYEFDAIIRVSDPDLIHIGHENKTLGGMPSCIVRMPVQHQAVPNHFKYLRLWSA